MHKHTNPSELNYLAKNFHVPKNQGVTNLSPLKKSCPEIWGWLARKNGNGLHVIRMSFFSTHCLLHEVRMVILCE